MPSFFDAADYSKITLYQVFFIYNPRPDSNKIDFRKKEKEVSYEEE